MDENNYSVENSREEENENLQNGFNSSQNQDGEQPGRGAAIAGMVLGIVSIVFWFFGAGAVVGLVTGIVGLICSANSKKLGYVGGMQTAGFVCSLIGLIGSALVFVACVACVGALGTAGALGAFK